MNYQSKIQITGELTNWRREGSVVVGAVKDDVHDRFVDGEIIRTSRVVKIEGDLCHTLNSIYRLVPAPAEEFKTTILWSESPDSGDKAITYTFATKEELDAFLKGVSEAGGWHNYRFVPEGFVVPATGWTDALRTKFGDEV